ncbi:unannotated protein [freshwater metagenome]|uniref:Unannotated protein n=1 Tax=freshwater metagenome TaxID=449393 RepID=A0A6J6W5T7_9ZZZZ
MKPATDETLITMPEFRSFILGSATCINLIGVRTNTFKTSSSFTKSLIVNALLIPKPALLIKTSTSLLAMKSSTFAQPDSVARSATSTIESAPYFDFKPAARSFNLTSSRATKTRLKPSAASKRVKLSPIPEDAPVTKAHFFISSPLFKCTMCAGRYNWIVRFYRLKILVSLALCGTLIEFAFIWPKRHCALCLSSNCQRWINSQVSGDR